EPQEIHDGEGADQRQRHHDAGDQRRRPVAQEDKGHQHDQPDGDEHFHLHMVDGIAYGLRAVGGHHDIDAGGHGLLQRRQHGHDAVHYLDHVGAGLLLYIQQDGGLPADPGGLADVLGVVAYRGDVAQPQRGAVGIGQDQVLIVLYGAQLIVGIDGNGTLPAVQVALGLVGIGRGYG